MGEPTLKREVNRLRLWEEQRNDHADFRMIWMESKSRTLTRRATDRSDCAWVMLAIRVRSLSTTCGN